MTLSNATLAVVPATVVAEAIELANGHTFVTELHMPRRRYAIVMETAGQIEIIAMHDDETDAVEAAKRLEGQLVQMAKAPAGETIQ